MGDKKQKSFFKFGECRSTKIFIEISKGHRHKKEEKESYKTDEETNDVSEEVATTPPDTPEKFSTVDLSTSDETETTKPSKGEQFMDRLKKSSVGKLFKSESKDSEISIYTLDQGMGRSPQKQEENPHHNELRARLRNNLYREADTTPHCLGRSVASQANSYPPYRLYFLPPSDWKDNDSKLHTISRFLFCQCSLACFLLFWLISTALLFYLIEGPYENELVENLKVLENSTMVSMATDLRILESDWDEALMKYMEKHREEILTAVRNGYNNETTIWTFPGSLLSAVSIITTLGLAGPLPATSGGTIGAIIFTCFGLPIHLIFITHLGRTIAVKVQLFAKETENKVSDLSQRISHVRRFGEDRKQDTWPEKMFMLDFTPPPWLCFFPVISYILYYIVGILVFGVARNLSTSEIFVFFVGFSNGRDSNGFSRMGYSWYLEGLAILTGINIAILRDSPMSGFTLLVQPLGLVTNSID